MTSTDRELLISINGEIQFLRKDVQAIGERVTRLENTTSTIQHNIDIITLRTGKIEEQVSDLKGYVNTWFIVIAVVIAFVGVFVPLILSRRHIPL